MEKLPLVLKSKYSVVILSNIIKILYICSTDFDTENETVKVIFEAIKAGEFF